MKRLRRLKPSPNNKNYREDSVKNMFGYPVTRAKADGKTG
jgi:hypothetical protein